MVEDEKAIGSDPCCSNDYQLRITVAIKIGQAKGFQPVDASVDQAALRFRREIVKIDAAVLERDGYLDTWRRPQKMGRPEMVYRLTRRTHDLFPCDSNDFTIELLKSIKEVYGPNGPEKMLFNVFERKTAALKAKVKGDTVVERAKWLAAQREKDGFMSQFVGDEKEGGPQILECHSPILNLLDEYPIIGRLEHDLVGGVLGVEVRREETRTSGLYECAFYFAL